MRVPSAGDLDDAHLCQRRLEAEHALAHPPPANCAMADTWVGTSTGNSVPSRSPTWTVRVARSFDPTAATVATGPKMWTSVVM